MAIWLVGWRLQIFAGRDAAKGFLLLVAEFAHEEIEELRAFIPPVPEQLGVIRRNDDRRTIQKRREPAGLARCVRRENAARVRWRRRARGRAGKSASRPFAGDAVIFDAGEPAVVRRGQMRLDVIEIEVEADVAVEIAVARVAGITFVLAPDLPRGIEVAPERGDAVGREDRRERAVARTRLGVQNAVRVENEPADVRLLQKLLDAAGVGAFRQPDAARIAPETAAVMVARGEDLRADGRRMVGHQRQQSVRGGGGDDFQHGLRLETA